MSTNWNYGECWPHSSTDCSPLPNIFENGFNGAFKVILGFDRPFAKPRLALNNSPKS